MEKILNIDSPLKNFKDVYRNNLKNNPEIITNMYYSPDFYSLANGMISWVIIMNNRQLNGFKNYELQIHNLIKNRVTRNNVEQIFDPGLFNGLAGILYVLSNAAKDERYLNLIHGILPYLKNRTYSKIQECYENRINRCVKDSDYDLISGLSGILKCYLNKSVYKHIVNNNIIHDIANCLKNYFDFKNFNNIEELMFYIPNENNPYINSKKGLINLSHSHGIMGILSSLNYYYKIFEDEDTKKCIEKICNFVYKFYSDRKKTYVKKIYKNEKIQFGDRNYTWCYGDLVMMQTFYNAALIIQNESYKKICLEFFEAINIKYRKLLSPTLCHGNSGVLLQLLHFRKIHRPRNVNLAFFNVIKDYEESYIYKFRDCEKYDGRRYYLDKNNLLTGSLGIYYAIDLYFGLEDHVGLLNLIM